MATTKRAERRTAEEALLNRVLEVLESGETPPWRRDWSNNQGAHRNLLTGAEYNGTNIILLEIERLTDSYSRPLWIGYKQAKERGWYPRKGSHCARIIRPQLNKREDVEENGETTLKAWVTFHYTNVFNVDTLDCNDDSSRADLETTIEARMGSQQEPPQGERHARAESILGAWEVPVEWGGTMAGYMLKADRIIMPDKSRFSTRDGLLATWAHECIHSTGHQTRLKRNMEADKRSDSYAREELVAELGSILLCNRLGIGMKTENHVAYLAEWAKLLRERGASTLLSALSDARKAAELICPATDTEAA